MSAPLKLNADEIQVLADRLFALSISSLATVGPRERADMAAASRALRGLLRHFELATGRQVQNVLLAGRV
jgi:hypothetical protein